MSEINVDADMIEFRRNMLIIGIVTIAFLVPFAGIVAAVFLFLSIGIIRRMNSQFNSPNLEIYCSKLTAAVVLLIIGNIFQSVATSGINSFGWWTIIPFYIGIVFFIISGALQMNAWDNMRDFLEQNKEMFQDHDVGDLIEGSERLRTAGLMYVLSFLIVPLFIGWIFQIIGYFRIGTFNTPEQRKRLASQKPVVPPKESPEPVPEPKEETPAPEETKYCPNCGAEVKGEGNFCGECGSSVN